ncbi:MAG: SDR family oxidoreductase [Pseudomonadota bacterium]
MGSERLKGKIALISGGASGIGAATARRFIEDGAQVILGDVNLEKAEALAAALGPGAKAIMLDVRDPAQWQSAFTLAAEVGAVTTVINSAGISIPGSIEDIDLEQFRAILQVNLEGVFLGCKYGVEAMKDGTGGAIINIGSTLSIRPGAIFAAYSSSKGGMRILSRSVALHCAEQGYDIRVNTVLPGAIATEMVEGYIAAGINAGQTREDVIEGFASTHPMKRLGEAEEVANAAAFLASDEASFTTGTDLAIDGGFLA